MRHQQTEKAKEVAELPDHDPRKWGPIFWAYYDYLAKTYPEKPNRDEQKALRMMFSSQKFLLPCTTCTENYRTIYKKHPPQTHSRAAFQKWLKTIKSEVAKHAKK